MFDSIFKCIIFVFCSDAVVSQVLDELGLQLTDQLTGLPIASGSLASTTGIAAKGGPQAAAAAGGGTIDADADLQARLNNLRREWTKYHAVNTIQTTKNSFLFDSRPCFSLLPFQNTIKSRLWKIAEKLFKIIGKTKMCCANHFCNLIPILP